MIDHDITDRIAADPALSDPNTFVQSGWDLFKFGTDRTYGIYSGADTLLLYYNKTMFKAAGLEVDARQHRRKVAYKGLGEFVYLLALTPWQLPDLDLERDLDALLRLEAGLTTADGLVVTESRDLIIARKP